MVAKVRELYSAHPRKIERIFRNIEKTAKGMLSLLLTKKYPQLGDLFKENEKLLEELKVVSSQTQSLIRKIEKIGGGAKISGAGGIKRGSGIILAYHQEPGILLNFAQKEKLSCFEVKLGEEGVRIEKS